MGKKILSYCRITDEKVILNGNLVLLNNNSDSNHWITDIYNYTKLSYPKFHKMDRLSKAGVLAAEMVMAESGFDNDNLKSDWALCCMNSSASLNDDEAYQKTIQNADEFYPAPSLFVYTLPNIVLGEIAIRHKLRCESSFYVCEKFSADSLYNAIEDVYLCGSAKYVMGGWLELGRGGCDILLFVVGESDDGSLQDFSIENFGNLYLKK